MKQNIMSLIVTVYAIFGYTPLQCMKKQEPQAQSESGKMADIKSSHIAALDPLMPMFVQVMLEQETFNSNNTDHTMFYHQALFECVIKRDATNLIKIITLTKKHYPKLQLPMQKEISLTAYFFLNSTYHKYQRAIIKKFILSFKGKATSIEKEYQNTLKKFIAKKTTKDALIGYMEETNKTLFESIQKQKKEIESSLIDFHTQSILVNEMIYYKDFWLDYPNFEDKDLTKHIDNLNNATNKITKRILLNHEKFTNPHALELLEGVNS